MAPEQQTGDFGAHLRQARERKGISLRAIADVTRISVRALEALERNDVSRLPAGIFGRGFVRSYASEVGLDPDVTVEEFIRSFANDAVGAGHPTTVQHADAEAFENTRRLAALAFKLVVIAVPVAGLLIYFGLTGWPGTAKRAARSAGASVGAVVAPAGPRALRLVVDVTARTDSTLSYASDGQPSLDVVLPAASRRTLDATSALRLTVSDPAAIDVQINGQPARRLGPAGVPATVHLTLDNYRASLVTP